MCAGLSGRKRGKGGISVVKKVLFVATVAIHFEYFYLPYFRMFRRRGWCVHTVCADGQGFPDCDKHYTIPLLRSPLRPENAAAYRQLKIILRDNDYDLIHCNTPVGGVLARLAARPLRKRGTKVIYTAHGFHFYNGAPLWNWLLYFPIEWWLSRYTDCLITINEEDFVRAKKHFRAGEVVHIHGVGYDDAMFVKPSTDTKRQLRRRGGYADEEVLLVYVAEMNNNKNQMLLIRALKLVLENHCHVRLLLIGPDGLGGKNQQLAESLGIADRIEFLGQRTDVHALLAMCDIAVASSFREGLPVNIMEALACGLPVIATDNRGHRALVKDGVNGFLVSLKNPRTLAEKVLYLAENAQEYAALSENAQDSVSHYARSRILEDMRALYERM